MNYLRPQNYLIEPTIEISFPDSYYYTKAFYFEIFYKLNKVWLILLNQLIHLLSPQWWIGRQL